MGIVMYYFFVSMLCSIFSLLRFRVSLGLLERPLVIGLVWAVFTGEWALSMSVAIFFELAWLDLIPAGTFIPPHLTAATLSTLALLYAFDLNQPGEALVAILVSIPLSWLGTQLEAKLRTRQSRDYDTVKTWLEKDDATPFPDTLVWRAMWQSFLLVFAGFYICIILLHGLVWLVLPFVASILASLQVTWPHLWIGASLGGLMALRLRRAYAVFAFGLLLVMILTFASIL